VIRIEDLPHLNAGLNAASAVLLVTGWRMARAKRIAAHRACMLSAVVASTLFLVSYVVYHFGHAGLTAYPGTGLGRALYYALLGSHTVLAATVPFLAGITLTRALKGDIARHRAIARWTFPIWLYVSVTGVAVWFVLYVVVRAR